MSQESEHAPVKPTVIDLDPDQVVDDARPAAEQAAPAAPPSRTSRRGWILPLAALVAGTVGGGWLYRDVLSGYLPSDQMVAMAETVKALQANDEAALARLDSVDRLSAQLKADVDALESNATSLTGQTVTMKSEIAAARSGLGELEKIVGDTKTAIAALEARPQSSTTTASGQPVPADVMARIVAIEKEIAALKAQDSTANQDTVALAQALSDLKAKVEEGTGFSAEFDRISRMVPAAEGLDVLGRNAAQGLPDAKGLALELNAIKLELPAPAAAAPASEPGWWDSFVSMLSTVVTIRDADAEDWPLAADKAIALAETDDLAQAIAVLDDVEGTMPDALRIWRDKAAARIELVQAVASVTDAVNRTMAARQ